MPRYPWLNFFLEQVMIDENCPNEADETIMFLAQEPAKTQFKFESFKFTDLADQSPINIECGVTICDTVANGVDCNKNMACGGARRRRSAQTELKVSQSHVVKTKINVF